MRRVSEMALEYVAIVIDKKLWSDELDDQMNAIEQGLINARGKPEKYPIIFSMYRPPEKNAPPQSNDEEKESDAECT